MTARTLRVGDILELVREPVRIDPAKTYPQIGIYSFGKGIIRREPTPGAELSKLRYYKVPPDALILSNIKAWEGAIAVSSEEETGFIASNRFLSYRPVSRAVDVSYLRYFFLSSRGLPLIEAISPGMADRNRTLGIDAFENLKIPLPDITEQRRIASMLSYLRRQRKVCADAVLRAEVRVGAIHDSLCRMEGTIHRVGDVLILVREPVRIDPAKTYPQIGIYSFGKGIIRREPTPGAELSKLRYYKVPPDALILSNIQAWEGAIAVSSEEESGFIASNRFLSYRPVGHAVDVDYLRYFFLSDRGHPLIQQASPGTMVRNRTLGIDAFENLKIPLPHITEQRRITSVLDRVYAALRRIHDRERQFDALLASALNAAFADL